MLDFKMLQKYAVHFSFKIECVMCNVNLTNQHCKWLIVSKVKNFFPYTSAKKFQASIISKLNIIIFNVSN